MTGVTPEIAKIIGFPKVTPEDVTRISAQQNEHIERITSKTLRDWPWDPELGKPHGFDPGAIEQNVKDLARSRDGHPGFSPPSPAALTLAKAISLIDGERDKQHGERHANFGHAAKLFTAYLAPKLRPGDEIMPAEVAWLMVLMKMSRDFNGAHNADNATDACGYAAIAGELADAGC